MRINVMRISVSIYSCDECGRSSLIAKTSDPVLVRSLLQGLLSNHQIEDDEQDQIFMPHFPKTARAMIATLTDQIRAGAMQALQEDDEQTLPEVVEGMADDAPTWTEIQPL